MNKWHQIVYSLKILTLPSTITTDIHWSTGVLCQGSVYRKSTWYELLITWVFRNILLWMLWIPNNQWRLGVVAALRRVWPKTEDEGCSRSDIAKAYATCLGRFSDEKLPALADVTLRKYPRSKRFDGFIRQFLCGHGDLLQRHDRLARELGLSC